jgi:hypothetical protein
MSKNADEPWAAWAEQMQKWMNNPAALNPFAPFGATNPSMAGFSNPFASAATQTLDPQSLFKALDPAEIERRIADMRAVESWLKLSLSTLDMSIKAMEMQRDAYASFAKMSEHAKAGTEAVRKTARRAARSTRTKR